EMGEVPLKVKLRYRDLKGREYESERVFLINVSDVLAKREEEREERKAFRAVRGFPEELLEIYEVEGFLGEGGFARVYKVRRKRDGELVAVKIPKGIDATTGKSFLRELTNWRNLRHENIVEISDANIFPVPYLEMEYCDKSLADIEFSVEDALNIAIQIAEGLKYAHSKGIAHKDLKPQNILIKNGEAKISDWGLSKALSESTSSLQAFSPFYAAPEQISKKFGKTDEKTDIWQFGVLLYEILTGKRPFEGDDVVQIAFSILNEEPAPPSTFRKEAAIFDEIVMRCLRKRKEERPSAEEIHAYLAKILKVRLEKQLEASKDFGESREILKSLARLHTLTEEYEETARCISKIADISSGNEREIARKIANAFRLLLEMREICEKHPRVSDVVEKYEMILDALPANMAEAFDADERIGLLFKRMKAELRDEQHLDTPHIEELRHFCHLFAERCLAYFLRG
ncbi:MAG: serine/threonine protein kinase, partial [Methanophagales archaeon]|nr:serine/threonine protein kinase [Methanophagales archaeon]